MSKRNRGFRWQFALWSCLAMFAGLTTAAVAIDHPSVDMLDANGVPISAAAGPQPAYSSKHTCNQCHNSVLIEQHSYHSQIGANEQVGFNSFNPNSSNPYLSGVATKGKSWVQSPGHVGKW